LFFLDPNPSQAYSEIQFIASKLHIPGNIKFEAQVLYKRVKESGELNGHHYHYVAAACMYIATRRKGAGRSIKEIAAASTSVHAKLQRNIGRCYTKIRDTLELNDLQQSTEQTYLARFCNKLGYERGVTTICNDVARRARDMDICQGRQAVSIAAATIFMVAQVIGRPVSARDVATVTGHAEQTIKASYRQMWPARHYLFGPSERVSAKAVHLLHFWGEPEAPGQLEAAQKWAAKNDISPLVYSPEENDVKPQIIAGNAVAAGPVAMATEVGVTVKQEPR
jgi:transcription initiation factor TFIIIB Brf1 subunit/transcription initiation factor TFIIB